MPKYHWKMGSFASLCMMSPWKVIFIRNPRWPPRRYDVSLKSYFGQKSKMAAKMAAKRIPWDTISWWEHENSFTRHWGLQKSKLEKYINRVHGDAFFLLDSCAARGRCGIMGVSRWRPVTTQNMCVQRALHVFWELQDGVLWLHPTHQTLHPVSIIEISGYRQHPVAKFEIPLPTLREYQRQSHASKLCLPPPWKKLKKKKKQNVKIIWMCNAEQGAQTLHSPSELIEHKWKGKKKLIIFFNVIVILKFLFAILNNP